jgi:hypothetical protein
MRDRAMAAGDSQRAGQKGPAVSISSQAGFGDQRAGRDHAEAAGARRRYYCSLLSSVQDATFVADDAWR